MSIQQLEKWIEYVHERNEALKVITAQMDKRLDQLRLVTDSDEAAGGGVELLFACNRLDHMLRIWVGEASGEEDD